MIKVYEDGGRIKNVAKNSTKRRAVMKKSVERIGIVDVAAETGGALSVLSEFYEYIKEHDKSGTECVFFTSIVDSQETEKIKVIKSPEVKKGWGNRLFWEQLTFPRLMREYHITKVLSLQNKALPVKNIPQYVYFHNALHFLPPTTFNIFDRCDRQNFIYCLLLSPMSLRSLKRVRKVITQTNTIRNKIMDCTGLSEDSVITVSPQVKISVKSGNNPIKGFLYPSKPVTYKRHELIVDAVRKAGKSFDGEILFTMTGDEDGHARRIKNSCKNYPNVKFIGYKKRDEILEFYQDYGLIFSSDIESFPIPFAEAMAYGAPVVARNMDYAREALEGYGNCFFYDNVGGLVQILRRYKTMRRGKGHKNEGKPSWGKIMGLLLED